MKPTILSYAVFIVFVITTQSIPSITLTRTATAAEDIVYDISGKKVLSNVPYYIAPVIWAKGGGVKLADTKNNKKICPSYVVQDPVEVNKGDKFKFIIIGKPNYLITSYILSIDSGSPSKGSCNMSTYWQISDPEANAPSNLITTGGSFDTAATCFVVKNYPKPTSPKLHSYMLQYCPWMCGAGPRSCFNISLYEDKGVRHLASKGATPFEFVFRKA